MSQVLPGWVLSLLAGSLLLPVLVASVDAFARARRRHVDVLKWLRWLGAWVAPFLAALAVAQFLALVGATPAPPPAPVPPDVLPVDGAALGVMAGIATAMVLAFLLARWLATRPDPELERPTGPGSGVALGAGDRGGLAAPLARESRTRACSSVPAAHLWMLLAADPPAPVAADPRPPDRHRRRSRRARGHLPPVRAVARPPPRTWYLVMLVTGHSVGVMTSLIACVMLAAACASIEAALRWPDVHASESS